MDSVLQDRQYNRSLAIISFELIRHSFKPPLATFDSIFASLPPQIFEFAMTLELFQHSDIIVNMLKPDF